MMWYFLPWNSYKDVVHENVRNRKGREDGYSLELGLGEILDDIA